VFCPSKDCGSSNVEHLPHYWKSLPSDSPLKTEYAQPAAPDPRNRLLLAALAVAGLVLAVTGQVAVGLVLLAVGAVGAAVAHGRIEAVEAARAVWERRRICLACTHLWEA
jgi:hypothetical protein